MRSYPTRIEVKDLKRQNDFIWETDKTYSEVFSIPFNAEYEGVYQYWVGIFQFIVDKWNDVRGTTAEEDLCPLPPIDTEKGKVLLFNIADNYYNRINNRVVSANVDSAIRNLAIRGELQPYADVGSYENYYFHIIEGYTTPGSDFEYIEMYGEYKLCDTLATQFIQLYGDALRFIRDMYNEEYDPLENYSGREITTYNDVLKTLTKGSHSELEFLGRSDKNTTKQKTNISTTNNRENVNQEQGFQGNAWRNANKQKDNTTATTYGGMDDNVVQSQLDHIGKERTTLGGTDTEKQTGSVELYRHGNLGVTTSAQMREGELNFWLNPRLTFQGVLFSMLDELLITKIY